MNDEHDEKDEAFLALESLSLASQRLVKMKSSEIIELTADMLQILSTDAWIHAGNWTYEEKKVCKLRGARGDRIESFMKFVFGNDAVAFLQSVQNQEIYKMDKNKKPSLLKKVRETHGATVYGPIGVNDLLLESFEVWARDSPALNINNGKIERKENGEVCVVLGAGNVSGLSLVDALHHIFINKSAVVIKHHPLREHLIKPYETILQPLIDRGFVTQVLDYGIPFTQKLISSQFVTHVHITGSFETCKAVQKSLSLSRPTKSSSEIKSMVSGELGCVTPFVIAPGSYRRIELRNIAKMLVGAKKGNGGHICLSPQVLILPKGWKQSNRFRKFLLNEIKSQPTPPTYYPGIIQKRESLLKHYNSLKNKTSKARVQIIKTKDLKGNESEVHDQLALIDCGCPDANEYYEDLALKFEAFGSVLAHFELPYDPDEKENDYLNSVVVPFLNNKSNIFGSLSCSLIVPSSLTHSESTQKAIASLKYGSIAVNSTGFFAYFARSRGGVWGAHPHDITGQSGNSMIGNQYDLPGVEKTVVYGMDLRIRSVVSMHLPPTIFIDIMRIILMSQGKLDGCHSIAKHLWSKFKSLF